MPHSDSDLHARATKAVETAREYAEPYFPTDTPEHAEYDLAARLLVVAELAAAGLALREAVPDACAGRPAASVIAVRPIGSAALAYDRRLRAALAPGTDVATATGAAAGEAT